jgi:hypothetical protein
MPPKKSKSAIRRERRKQIQQRDGSDNAAPQSEDASPPEPAPAPVPAANALKRKFVEPETKQPSSQSRQLERKQQREHARKEKRKDKARLTKRLKARPARVSAKVFFNAAKVFVGGLAWTTTETQLAARFEQFGEIVDVRVCVFVALPRWCQILT